MRVINGADDLSRQLFGDAVADELSARLALIKAQTSASPGSSSQAHGQPHHADADDFSADFPTDSDDVPDEALTLTA